MKNYKAMVIDGKKLIRRCIISVIVLIVLSVAVINARIELGKNALSISADYPKYILEDSIPLLQSADNGVVRVLTKIRNGAKNCLKFFLTFDPEDAKTVLCSEVPMMKTVSSGYLASEAQKTIKAQTAYNPKDADKGQGVAEPTTPESGEQYPIKEIDSGQAQALKGSSNKILIRNDTRYSINVDELLNAPLKFNMKGDGPKILIVHTHATESYTPEGAASYSAGQSDRSLEESKNMIRVGKAMAEVFRERGISVLHDTTLHDHPNFNGSYENSRKTVESYLAKYPSICIVLDIHRDAFVYDDGTKAKFATEINGKKVAQLMFVVGTDAGGLEHPQWRENMKLALKFQSYISDTYPSLMRGVNLRTERFNGHTTYGSMIIEVGSSGNTISEAVDGAKYGAGAMADFLNKLK